VAGSGPEIEGPAELRPAAEAALRAAGIGDGHLTVELVGPERIKELNRSFRNRDEVTDVFAFPVDESGPSAGPRELGDVVICAEETHDLEEAVVHGVLHLAGHDHERDGGEMLELQRQALSELAGATETRSGFVAVAGRPNVGKSTLVNAIVGAKVAAISDKPQTTRRAIRGVVSGGLGRQRWQLVLVDLPGVQRPLDALTERMQSRVEQELADCDAVLLILNGAERVGGGDRFIAHALARSSVPVVAAVNKVDLLDKGATLVALDAAGALEREGVELEEIFPVSALKGSGVEPLTRALVSLLPPGPFFYPEDVRSDQPRELAIAELVREQALARTREEVPHSIEVKVEEMEHRDDVMAITAVIWVETSSQKGILIGKGGAMIREIGTASRRQVEALLDERVYLELTVKVRKRWRRDESMLDRLGV
jgi:GTP-binding protein Era